MTLSPSKPASQPASLKATSMGSKRSAGPEHPQALSWHAIDMSWPCREARGDVSRAVNAFYDPQPQRASQPASPKAAGKGSKRSAVPKKSTPAKRQKTASKPAGGSKPASGKKAAGGKKSKDAVPAGQQSIRGFFAQAGPGLPSHV